VTALLVAALVLAPPASLPGRIRRIVLHVPGGPCYAVPERRFVFFPPEATQALWTPMGGTQWIVWTDGSLWPRHVPGGQPRSWAPPADGSVPDALAERVAAEAAPVYSNVHWANSASVGIEVAHSGRSGEPFPAAQVRSLAWLLRTLLELSGGRLTPAAILGHKDLDGRPAYVREGCARPGCPVFVDDAGRPYRRRVDPPESLFRALAAAGLAIPRPGDGDAELRRAEAIPPGARPAQGVEPRDAPRSERR
jgi:hypothetical protein